MIVAIDGPAGSGKSSTARAVAERLGFLYLDTGAMYRAVALAFVQAGEDATPAAAERVLPSVSMAVQYEEGSMRVLLNGDDITAAIRRPDVGNMASNVARLRAVRARLVAEQQQIGRMHDEPGVVLDGRDIGTVVFPDADVKIFMVADAAERARRRQRELAEQGHDVPFERLLAEINERDRQDMQRDIAPLRKAEDAIELNTTAMTFDEQVAFVVDCVRERHSERLV